MRLFFIVLFFIVFRVDVLANANYLALSDKYRSQFDNTQLGVTIEEYKNYQVVKSIEYQVYNNDKSDSLVLVKKGKNAGNRILLTSKGMYLLVKKASRPIRITPLQRLIGQASYGDLASLRLSDDYDYTIHSKDDNYIILNLTAKSRKSTYRKMTLWLSANDYRPIKADVFLPSGKRFKKVIYSVKDNTVDKIIYVSNSVDDINSEKTVMLFKSVKPVKISKRFFTNMGMKGNIK